MKKFKFFTLVLTLIIASSGVFAQKAVVEEKLKEYGIPQGYFEDNLKQENSNHTFQIGITTKTSSASTGDTKEVEIGVFNPKLEEGKRWTLNTVDGNSPTNKQIKHFNKAHNSSDDYDFGEPDDNDWKIIEDNENQLIVEFRYREENLPHKYKYLAGCIGKVFINKMSKRLEKIEFRNDGPIKVRIFNVSKLNMVIYYLYDEETNTYLMEKEDVLMDAKMLGQSVEVEMITEFSDYKKVN